MVIGLHTPFPIRIPCPAYPSGEIYTPLTAAFDGSNISVTFAESPEGDRMWFQKQRDLTFAYYPTVSSVDEAVFVDAVFWGLTPAEHKRFHKLVKAAPCGKGTIFVTGAEMLRKIRGPQNTPIGGATHIYVISARGSAGAVCIPSSIYNDFDPESFDVGVSRDWRHYLKLDEIGTPVRIGSLGQWQLWIRRSSSVEATAKVLENALEYATNDALALARKRRFACAGGFRSTLLELQSQLASEGVDSAIQFDDEVHNDLPWYDLIPDND